SKLLPDALASKCAFSNSPQPSPVDVLSACNVATGTPVSSDILVRFAPRETTALNSRKNIAVIKLIVFILIKLPSCREVSVSTRLMVAYSREKLKMAVAFSGRERRADAVRSDLCLLTSDPTSTATHRDQRCRQ